MNYRPMLRKPFLQEDLFLCRFKPFITHKLAYILQTTLFVLSYVICILPPAWIGFFAIISLGHDCADAWWRRWCRRGRTRQGRPNGDITTHYFSQVWGRKIHAHLSSSFVIHTSNHPHAAMRANKGPRKCLTTQRRSTSFRRKFTCLYLFFNSSPHMKSEIEQILIGQHILKI